MVEQNRQDSSFLTEQMTSIPEWCGKQEQDSSSLSEELKINGYSIFENLYTDKQFISDMENPNTSWVEIHANIKKYLGQSSNINEDSISIVEESNVIHISLEYIPTCACASDFGVLECKLKNSVEHIKTILKPEMSDKIVFDANIIYNSGPSLKNINKENPDEVIGALKLYIIESCPDVSSVSMEIEHKELSIPNGIKFGGYKLNGEKYGWDHVYDNISVYNVTIDTDAMSEEVKDKLADAFFKASGLLQEYIWCNDRSFLEGRSINIKFYKGTLEEGRKAYCSTLKKGNSIFAQDTEYIINNIICENDIYTFLCYDANIGPDSYEYKLHDNEIMNTWQSEYTPAVLFKTISPVKYNNNIDYVEYGIKTSIYLGDYSYILKGDLLNKPEYKKYIKETLLEGIVHDSIVKALENAGVDISKDTSIDFNFYLFISGTKASVPVNFTFDFSKDNYKSYSEFYIKTADRLKNEKSFNELDVYRNMPYIFASRYIKPILTIFKDNNILEIKDDNIMVNENKGEIYISWLWNTDIIC